MAILVACASSAHCQPMSATGDAKTEAVFAAFPNTQLTYYPVEGSDPSSIRASMNARRPYDDHENRGFDARSTWHIGWRWQNNADGTCDLTSVTMNFRATVILPKLVDENALTRAVSSEWHTYLRALYKHEAGHVRHAYDGIADVANAVRSTTCANANQAGHAALDVLRRYDIEYDAATHHGATQGATFPPRTLANTTP